MLLFYIFFIHHHSHVFRHCVVSSQDSKSHDGKCLWRRHQLQHEFFSIGDEVFTESSLQQTLVGKSENNLHKSEGNNPFSEAPLTSSEEIWRVDKIWWQLSVSSRWLTDDDPSSTTLPTTTIMLILLLWLVKTSLPTYWSWPSLISSKCYIHNKVVLQGCVTPSLCWDLDLLHVNDIHVRMEETNKYSAACRSSTFDLKTEWILQLNIRTFSHRDKVYFWGYGLCPIFFSLRMAVVGVGWIIYQLLSATDTSWHFLASPPWLDLL